MSIQCVGAMDLASDAVTEKKGASNDLKSPRKWPWLSTVGWSALLRFFGIYTAGGDHEGH